MEFKTREYLGNGIYVDYFDFEITISCEYDSLSKSITLDSRVLKNFMDYVDKARKKYKNRYHK